jgi:hypothetical protein
MTTGSFHNLLQHLGNRPVTLKRYAEGLLSKMKRTGCRFLSGKRFATELGHR